MNILLLMSSPRSHITLVEVLIRELINNSGFRPRPPAPPRPPVPPPPPPKPGRPPRPPMGPGPGRPPFNRSMYEQDYDIYEY